MVGRLLNYFVLVAKYIAIGIATMMLIIAGNANYRLQNEAAVGRSPFKIHILQIWWDKGYYPEEDEALRNVVSNWEAETNNKVKLSFYTNDELSQKIKRAIQAGDPPDILMNDGGDRTIGALAWQNKLTDVSTVIDPVKNIFDETMRSSAYLYNSVEQKSSYYAILIHVSIPHIFYWRDLHGSKNYLSRS